MSCCGETPVVTNQFLNRRDKLLVLAREPTKLKLDRRWRRLRDSTEAIG